MRKNAIYPITVKLFSDKSDLVYDIFRAVRPHKGTFIGVCELEGSFLCEEPKKLYDSLVVGEKLIVETIEARRLMVKRQDGTELGIVPFIDAVIPNMLIVRGLTPFAHFEAKELDGDMLSIVVSLYCEKY